MNAENQWRYCVIGNIKQTRIDKDGILRNGTPAFRGGAKVYICGKIWDFSREDIEVLGFSRGKRFYVDYISVDLIENVRLSKTFKPRVLEIMCNWEFCDGWWNNSQVDKEDAESFVAKWNSIHSDN